eukprot:2994452-Pyramimonas_sp.AAC.1
MKKVNDDVVMELMGHELQLPMTLAFLDGLKYKQVFYDFVVQRAPLAGSPLKVLFEQLGDKRTIDWGPLGSHRVEESDDSIVEFLYFRNGDK